MALQARRHMENAFAAPVGGKQRLETRRQGRTALLNIQNKVTAPPGNGPNIKKPVAVKGRMTRRAVALSKENLTTKQVTRDKPQDVKPLPVAIVTDAENDLSTSLMDVSISEPEGYSSKILPKGVTDIDSQDRENEFLCSDLVMDIYKYLRDLEMKWSIRTDFLSKQRDITPRMRAILVDWLNQVHTRFGLLQETLYLTVAIIDRFLQEQEVSRKHLQLVGITAMFIACKYEEMYSPPVDDFVYVTDSAYNKKDIFKMECLILKTLQFSLGRPLPLHFLRRNSKAGDCDAVVHTVAKFFMELSLQEYELSVVPPSLLAASALRLSLLVIDNAPWTTDLSFYSSYEEEQLVPVITTLAKLVLRNTSSKLQAVWCKYSSSKLMKVSTLPQLKSKVMEDATEGRIGTSVDGF